MCVSAMAVSRDGSRAWYNWHCVSVADWCDMSDLCSDGTGTDWDGAVEGLCGEKETKSRVAGIGWVAGFLSGLAE